MQLIIHEYPLTCGAAFNYIRLQTKCLQQRNIAINKMLNEQIKDKIESIWVWLKSLTSADMMHQIGISKAEAQAIIGKNEIQKVKTLPILKLIVYELIVFANQKCNSNNNTFAAQKKVQTFVSTDKAIRPLTRVQEIKQLLANINSRREHSSNQIIMDRYEYKSLTRKINSLEEQLSNEEMRKLKNREVGQLDLEGMELMIAQMQQLIKKKEGRIRELNAQLQQNFKDKQELEDDIQQLQRRNAQLEYRLNQLQEQHRRTSGQHQKLKQQLKAYSGTFSYIVPNPNKILVHCSCNTESIVPESELLPIKIEESIRDSNLMLAKYTPTQKDDQNQKRTVKKISQANIAKQLQFSQQNLLQSLRYLPQQKQPPLQSEGLKQLLLLQALVIEHVLQQATY